MIGRYPRFIHLYMKKFRETLLAASLSCRELQSTFLKDDTSVECSFTSSYYSISMFCSLIEIKTFNHTDTVITTGVMAPDDLALFFPNGGGYVFVTFLFVHDQNWSFYRSVQREKMQNRV